MKAVEGVLSAAFEVETYFRQQGWRFCFIGGVAVQRWGKPRFTQDVDATLYTGFGHEEKFVDEILKEYEGRLREARKFAIERRVLLVQTKTGIDLDFSLGAFPFEESSIGRASVWQVSSAISLTTCSAEDLIIHKVFAGRDRDWGDVQSVLVRQRGHLNLAHVRSELPPLLEMKDDIESLNKLEQLIERIEKSFSR